MEVIQKWSTQSRVTWSSTKGGRESSPPPPKKVHEFMTFHTPNHDVHLLKQHKSYMMTAKPLLIAISGPSSSGKTTLSRLLRDILPGVFILHEDDFYKADKDIPINANGVADWDCVDSVDLPALRKALQYIKEHGSSPSDLVSKEDQNSVGKSGVDTAVVEDLKKRAAARFGTQSTSNNTTPVAIVDGFLLLSDDMKDIRSLFDLRLFLRTDYNTAKTRREARSGYVTLEGFWEDPPGYVDEVVWPNYVKDHGFLFEKGNVEGELNKNVLKDLDIHAMPREAQKSMTRCLEWAYEILETALDARR
jgi:nicotinamide/nicotinate riboside kinase